jgi:hypothetical protein
MSRIMRTLPKGWYLAAALLLVTCVCGSVARAQGTWTTLSPVQCPQGVSCPTEGMAVGGVGEVIIGAYGFSKVGGLLGTDTNLTRLYNINKDSWSLGMPGPGSVLI